MQGFFGRFLVGALARRKHAFEPGDGSGITDVAERAGGFNANPDIVIVEGAEEWVECFADAVVA